MVEEFSLKRKVINGFIWMGTGTFFGQFLSWCSTIIIIRLLLPSDYGLMAMASTFVALLVTIGELGIGSSIIQAENIDEREIRAISGVIFITCACGLVVCFLLAPLIAIFYRESRLTPIIRVLAFAFVFLALYSVPQSLLMREMNFRKRAQVDVVSQVGGSLLTLFLALKGLEVWSLVFGFLTIYAIKAIGFNWGSQRIRPLLFGYKDVKKFINYGITVTGSRLLYSLYMEADKAIVGRFLGANTLGVYAVASQLSSIPAEKVLPIVGQVMFTSYSRIQNDMERIRGSIMRTTRAIGYIGFPIFFGMAAVAPEGIPLILGPKWANVVVPFQLLCIVMPLKALSPVLSPAVSAVGKPKVNLINMLINLIAMSIAFVVGVHFGFYGVCMAWVIVFPFLFLITSIRSLKVLGIPSSEFLSTMKFPLVASLLMAAVVLGLRAVMDISTPLKSLIASTVLGGVFYIAMVVVFKKGDILKLKEQYLVIK